MSEPLVNRRTQKPFREYAASPSCLEEEENEYKRFLAGIQPRKEPVVTGRMLLAWGLICVSLALALVAVIWFRP